MRSLFLSPPSAVGRQLIKTLPPELRYIIVGAETAPVVSVDCPAGIAGERLRGHVPNDELGVFIAPTRFVAATWPAATG